MSDNGLPHEGVRGLVDGEAASIRTERLELVPLTAAFLDGLVAGDIAGAEREIGALVSPWFAAQPAHFVQLRLAQLTRDSDAIGGLGRAIVIVDRTGRRRVVGSVGFHGSTDERGRLEVGCSIHPSYRRRGFTAEAMTALFEWAAARSGITRFLVQVPSPSGLSPHHRAEIEPADEGLAVGSAVDQIDGLGLVIETAWPPQVSQVNQRPMAGANSLHKNLSGGSR